MPDPFRQKKPARKYPVGLIALFLLLLPPVSARAAMLDSAIEKNLAPHKAVYDIQMVSRHSGAQILNLHGQMTYEWHPDCEAWITDHHFNLQYQYPDATPLNVVSDFSTYEPFDGKSLSFTSRRTRDGALYQELRGNAALGPDDSGKAQYSMPADLSFPLVKGALFPASHTIGLLQAIHDGKKFFHATVFDGSDDQGPVEVNAIAGKSVNALAALTPSPKVDASLLSGPAWDVRMAFFPADTASPESDYEMNAVMHANGVISDMRVDYKDFSVTQKLVSLERLKPINCGGK